MLKQDLLKNQVSETQKFERKEAVSFEFSFIEIFCWFHSSDILNLKSFINKVD